MFGNLNKPAFGATAPNTSFGFGSTSTPSANPFGQNQLFGKPATGTFGAASTSTFGQPANTSLFPSTQAQPTNMFQNANTTFGAPASTSGGFGTTNLFGQQQASTSGLFNTSSTFGQQNKPPGFGFGTQSAQPSLFGQQPQQQQASSIFQPSTSNLFGTTAGFGGQQSTGTVIKFNPVTGTDTMMKNGVAQSINTKHHSITCMKEYENKSFEELRFEDYMANRKGPQQQPGFGTTPFGATASSAPTLFGQTDASKSAFGQTTGFGQTTSTFGQNTSGFGLGNQQQQAGGLFGKPTGFGAPTSSASTFGFGSNTQTANPFGANQAAKPFGSTMQPIFGTSTATTQQSGFGTGLFGQTSTQNTAGSLFGKPAQATTGFGTSQPSTGFSFGPPASTQTSSLFQPNKPLFGQTSTTGAFGQSNTFGATSAAPFGSTFGKTTAPTFGTSQPSAFGTSMGGFQTTGTSLFGNAAAKPGGLFGNTTSTGLFGNMNNSFQSNTGFGMQQQPQQQSLFPAPEQQSVPNLALLTSDPFGDAPHLLGLEPKLRTNTPSVSATDPKELKALLDPQKKVDMSHNSKLKVFPLKTVRDSLFDGVSPKFKEDVGSPDYVKTNCRRLVLKQRPSSSGDGSSPSLMRTDILKHILSPDETKTDSKENSKNDSVIQNDLRSAPLRLTFDNTVTDRRDSAVLSQTYNVEANGLSKSIGPDRVEVSPLPSDDEDEEPSHLKGGGDATKKHPCGIICTRPEYYTLPNLEALSQYVDENGRCIVKGFTVGRKGYGNVYFPDEMDVSGLNIDELVHFRYREINVYPDDAKKPPVGQGLNRKAQVTLDNVFPRRSDTNTLIKDVHELLQMNFAEKLRKITVKKGAKFIDYRPETGSWVFKVDHFSRYGFDDSDEESEANDKEAQKKKSLEAKKVDDIAKKKPEEAGKEEKTKKSGEDKDVQAKYGMDVDIFVQSEDQFTADDDPMYVDNISEDDYHIVPTEAPLQFPYDPFTRTTSKNIQVMKSTLFADDDMSSEGYGSGVSTTKHYLDVGDELPHLPVIREEMVARKRPVVRPKVEKVYNFRGFEAPSGIIPSRTYMDMGMFKGKSFKVGWARGFDFFTANAVPVEGNGELCRNTIDIGTYLKDFDPLKEFLPDALEVVLEESVFDLDEKLVPTFKIQKGDSYLRKQAKLFSKLVSKYSAKESYYMNSVWTLAEALWGPAENTISNRRHLLSEWLKSNTNYDDLTDTTTTKRLFNQLSVFKVAEAANSAMDNRMPNLSLILSQLSVTNTMKSFLQEQIQSWYTSMTANHINDDMKRIYLLLAGIPIKEEINVFEDVDWKRAFGMHLWYVCPAGAPVDIAIETYREAFQSKGYAEMPTPPYGGEFREDGTFDLLYHVLVLYRTRVHRLSSVLSPATHTDDPLDYRLSWLLLQLFLSLDVGLVEDFEKTKLCTSFSNQLESLGKWEWAIFVLLYLDDNALKRTLVTAILDRNLSPDTDKNTIKAQNNLVNRMRVPPEWIHKVKAEKFLVLEEYFQAFNHFAHARDYNSANDVFMGHILPGLFINEQYDIIQMLAKELQPGSKEILRWSNDAGLFLDFLSLQEDVTAFGAEDILKLQMRLQSISDRVATFCASTDQQKLCIAEMSKRCASLYKELCKKSKSGLFKSSYSDFVETLVMPPDYKQSEALYLIKEFDNGRC